MEVYRIDKAGRENLEGIGGLKGSGRWHKEGNRIIYASESISLASWEKFVHMTDYNNLPDNLVVLTIEIPDDITIIDVPKKVLIPGWNVPEPFILYKEETIEYGTKFLKEKKHLVLRVPSAVIQGEFNFVINPNHPDIKRCKIVKSEPFKFDPRSSNTTN